MNNKIHSSYPYHSRNHKELCARNLVSMSHMYFLYILYLNYNICSHCRYYSEVHYFLVFLVIIYYEVIFLGTLSVGYPEKIYFC